MPVRTTPWSIQDHIKTPARQLRYLEAAFEDGDPGLVEAALGDIVKALGLEVRITRARKPRKDAVLA